MIYSIVLKATTTLNYSVIVTFQNLNQFYFELFYDYNDTSWAIFKTDMFLKSLTTTTFEFQKSERQLSNETFRDNLIKLYLPNEVTK